VFEPEYVTRLPAEAYQRVGLPANATADQLRARLGRHTFGLSEDPDAFEGFVTSMMFCNSRPIRIRLFPVDLNFASKNESRGRPRLASSGLARRVIKRVEARSKRFGIRIRYDPIENAGEVILG
jgi:hypothetical protein